MGLFVMYVAGIAGSKLIDFTRPEKVMGASLLLPGLLLACALAMLLYRSGLILDRRARVATAWWGLGFRWVHRAHPLGPEPRVTFHAVRRKKGKSGMTTFYVATLEGAAAPLLLHDSEEYERGRAAAEQAARYLDISLEDKTREPAEAVEPRARGAPLAVPTSKVTSAERTDGAWVVYLPPSRQVGYFVGAFIVAALSGWILMSAASSQRLDSSVRALMAGGWCLLVLFFTLRAERRRSLAYWLRASPEGIQVDLRWTLGGSQRLLPAQTLLQVEVVRGETSGTWYGAELLLRGETQSVRVGSHVPAAELRLRARELREAVGLRPAQED
jgi:hypothetical protein